MAFDRITLKPTTHGKTKCLVLSTFKGAALCSVDFFPPNRRELIQKHLGPSLPIPWETLDKEKFVEILRK